MSLACDSLLRHWVAMLWCLPGTCRRRVQLKFCTSNLRIRAEQVMLVHEETYLLLWAQARTHKQAHSLTNCSCKPKDGNSTFFFCYWHKAKAIWILVCTVHTQKLLFKSAQNFWLRGKCCSAVNHLVADFHPKAQISLSLNFSRES